MLNPAQRWMSGRFCIAGSLYPMGIDWPSNVDRIDHLPPAMHRHFYNSQRFALNVTRADMVKAGYSPSVRLFEAAACGTPVISDHWPGLNEIFQFGNEILVANTSDKALAILRDMSEAERKAIGAGARARVLAGHTCSRRAEQLENYVMELLGRPEATRSRAAV